MVARKTRSKVKVMESEAEQPSCIRCKHFMKLSEKHGLCTIRKSIKAVSYRCYEYLEGECMSIDVNTLLEYYLVLKEDIDDLQNTINYLRDFIIKIYGEGKLKAIETDKYVAIVEKVVQNRLDTNKVRKYLDELGKLDDFLVRSEFYRVIVKRR